MLTKDDLDKIQEIINPLAGKIGNLETKIDSLTGEVKDLQLETKAIHEIITTQGDNLEQRIERLEEQAGINVS